MHVTLLKPFYQDYLKILCKQFYILSVLNSIFVSSKASKSTIYLKWAESILINVLLLFIFDITRNISRRVYFLYSMKVGMARIQRNFLEIKGDTLHNDLCKMSPVTVAILEDL